MKMHRGGSGSYGGGVYFADSPSSANHKAQCGRPRYLVTARVDMGRGTGFGLDGETFFVSQGPMRPEFHGPDTAGTFWDLVWQQGVRLVAMLCRVAPGFAGWLAHMSLARCCWNWSPPRRRRRR